MRISHYLKDNKTSHYPGEFIFFDTETTPKVLENGDIDQPFKLGVALYWRRRDDQNKDTLEYLRFTKIPDFWKWVATHALTKHQLILIAHNIQFDFMVLGGFSALRLHGFELTKIITNGKSNILSYRCDNRSILCLDNMNYFPVALKALGEDVGLPKLTMPEGPQPLKVWFTYCQRDVDIMYTAWREWLSFLSSQDLGTWGKTITSQAFNAYRHRFMSHPILVSVNNKATEIERASYRGGRTECFQLGTLPKEDYYLLDINSLYPYCMKVNQYSTRQLYIKYNPPLEFLERVLKNRCVIGDVLVTVDKPIFGVRYNGRLIFPVGTFRVTLTSSELTRAVTTGSIIKIYALSVYHREFIFTDFVDYFYNQRLAFKKAGKPVYAYLCKKLLNHLYGKFGQRNEDWVFIGKEPKPVDYVEVEIDAQTGKRYTVRCIAGQVCRTDKSVEGYNSFAAISAEVTANARMLLWEFIEKAGPENVFYTDTDSLLVNKTGRDNLAADISQTALGKLKLAQKATKAVLHNVKDYQLGRKVKIKGISKTAKKVSEGNYITYQQQGVRAALHNENINTMTWRRVPKMLHRIYEKGVVCENGRVAPLILFHQNGKNYPDYKAMFKCYGEAATYRGITLRYIMRARQLAIETGAFALEGYSPAELQLPLFDDLET